MARDAAPFVGHLYEAARLRGLAHFNELDANFAAADREVVYYVDASVALLLLIWPGRLALEERHNREYVSSIGITSQDDEVVEAALAGEYLFSSELHGASHPPGRGHVDGPRLMTAPHWNEFTNRIRDYVRHRSEGESKEDLERAFNGALDKAARLLVSARSKAVDQAGDDIIEAASRLERTTMMEIAMLRRLRSGKLVQPASNLPRDVFYIDTEARDAWQKALSKTGKDRSIKADATAIAQIEKLNKREGPNGRRVHCLVTGDKHVHTAYFDKKVQLYCDEAQVPREHINFESGDFSSTYYLRHPAQFLPMLNQADMPNRTESTRLFDGVVSAAESLIAVIRCSERESLSLAMMALRSRQDAEEEIGRLIERYAHDVSEDTGLVDGELDINWIRERWARLRRHTVVMNRMMLSNRAQAALDMSSVIRGSSGELQELLEREQLAIVEEIQKLGLRKASREVLGQLAERLRSAHTEGMTERRARPPLLCGFDKLTGGARLEKVVTDLSKKGRRREEELDHNIQRLSETDYWQGLLFCATLAAFANRWSEVIWYAKRARDALGVEGKVSEVLRDEYYETLYLLALGRRMRLERQDYRGADRALKIALKHHGSRPESSEHHLLARARALSERGTLRLFEQFRRYHGRISNMSNPVEAPLSERDMDEARLYFKQALDIVKEHEVETTNEENRRRFARLVRHVRLQSSLNLCVLDLLGHEFCRDVPDFPDKVDDARLISEIALQAEIWAKSLAEEAAEVIEDNDDQRGSSATEVEQRPPTLTDLDRDVLALVRIKLNGDADRVAAQELYDKIGQVRAELPRSSATALDRKFAETLCQGAREIAKELEIK